MKHNYGLIFEERDPSAWVFGASDAPQEVLQENGQWDEFLPLEEYQYLYNVEPYACVTFSTFNAIETLLRRRYTQVENFSDRYTAKLTGTDQKKGNSPHYVAEYIRQYGGVYEKEWPFSSDINSFEKYYENPPTIPDKLLPEFVFNHEFVSSNPEAMKSALELSPLTVTVDGWNLDDADGLYYKKGQSNHQVMCYGFEDGHYWKIFDTYAPHLKRVKWDTQFEVVKRFHITRTKQSNDQLTYFRLLLNNLLKWLALKRAQIGGIINT